MHTQTWYTHGWCQPIIQWTLCSPLYLVEEFKKFFFQFFNFSTIFSAIASCITVCDVSQPLPLMFKRFSKTNISFLLRKLDPITFSPALLIKGRLGNLILSNPKKEHGLSNNKLTHRVCIQYLYYCVFVHICVFDVYARCCVYFLLSVCFLIVNIMLCLFMHFVCFLFCVCTAAFCPCMPFTQLRGFPKHPRLPLIPNSTFSNFRSNGPVLVIRRHSIRSTDFSYLLKCSPR